MGNKTTKRYHSWSMYSEQLGDDCKAIVTKVNYNRSWTDYRNGSNNPGWRQAIANESNATGGLTGEKKTMSYKPGLWEYYSIPTKPWTHSCARVKPHRLTSSYILAVPSGPPGIPNNITLENEAKNKGLIGISKKIRSMSTYYSGPVMLGELRETIRLIKSPASALRQKTGIFADRMSRIKRQNNTWSNAAAETWLEYAFGVVPLISDITGIAKAAQDIVDEGVKRLSFTGHSEAKVSQSVYWTSISPSFSCDYTRTTTDKYQAIYTVGYKVDIQASNAIDRIIDRGGFNLTEVVPTAWELVPWSFLIDYFSNIGDVLEASSTSLDNVKWAQLTVRGQRKEQWHSFIPRAVPAYSNYDKLRTLRQPSYIGTATKVSRSITDIGFPSFRFDLPGTSSQFLNMAALAKLKLF